MGKKHVFLATFLAKCWCRTGTFRLVNWGGGPSLGGAGLAFGAIIFNMSLTPNTNKFIMQQKTLL
jgi:hypothetical protein